MINKTTPKKVVKKNADVHEIYRKGSNYQKIFAILFKHRQKGITRDKLVMKAMAVTGRSEQLCRYDVGIVTSPSESGDAHRSANRGANYYYVIRMAGGFLQLIVRGK